MKKRILSAISFVVIFSVVFCNVFTTHASSPNGDINGDGKVNSMDALIVLQYSVGLSVDIKDFRAGDVNGDMILNSVDALIILQVSVGLIKLEDYSSESTTPERTTTRITTTRKTTTESTTATPSAIYNALAPQRKFGFNGAYDWGSKFVNFYLSTIRIYFTYDNKDWLVEFWKGEYSASTVGCEVGFYYREHNQMALDTMGPDNLLYKSVENQDAMPVSMKLWQYEKSTDSTPIQKIDYSKHLCWWAADFETGLLENHRDQTTLVMLATIDFPTENMVNLVVNQLKEKEFIEGNIQSYNNYETYSVNSKSLTICWKNFKESKPN